MFLKSLACQYVESLERSRLLRKCQNGESTKITILRFTSASTVMPSTLTYLWYRIPASDSSEKSTSSGFVPVERISRIRAETLAASPVKRPAMFLRYWRDEEIAPGTAARLVDE